MGGLSQALQHPEQWLQFGALGALVLVLLAGALLVVAPVVGLGVWAVRRLIEAVTDNHKTAAEELKAAVSDRLDAINTTLRELHQDQREMWRALIHRNTVPDDGQEGR